ncbi:unnamed protein product [Calypogeia fissa]
MATLSTASIVCSSGALIGNRAVAGHTFGHPSPFLQLGHPENSIVWRFSLPKTRLGKNRLGRDRHHGKFKLTIANSVRRYDSNDFEVLRLLSTYGYMNISSYGPPQSGRSLGGVEDNFAAGYNRRDVMQMSGPEMGEGGVQTRLYSGRISRGDQMGTRVLLKAYPGITARGTEGMTARGTEVDIMATNELISHATLQDATPSGVPRHVAFCYGGFRTRVGEQWLVFQDRGQVTAVDYAKAAGKATVDKTAVGEWDFWDRFDIERPIKRRQVFIVKLLRGAFSGLAYMHANDVLHQSLGPASIILNVMDERDVGYLVPQLRDLAFAVDVSDQGMQGSPKQVESLESVSSVADLKDLQSKSPMATLAADLWRRAAMAGASTPREKKNFGIADDIYAAGLLFAYVIFISLSEPGSLDGPSLQRLLENTFRLDLSTAREYFMADDRWVQAVQFLDLDDGAGWQLLQALLNPNFRMRPTAEAVLNHRFMTGDVL